MAAGPKASPVLITGVSTGIGRGIARVLVRAGIPVFGSVRSAEDGRAFEAELGETARAIVFDVRDGAAIRTAAARAEGETDGQGLAALVNNAGVAVAGPLETMPLDRFRDQLETGLVGILAVTQAFLPLLRARRDRGQPARVINISSVSGATAFPFLGAYAAAKFGLEALSDSLRRELVVHGIEVVVIQPGGVVTPIWEKAAAEDAAPYLGTPYDEPLQRFREAALATGAGGLPVERVGELVLDILRSRRPKARYLLTSHPVTERLMRVLPTRLLDQLIARRLGLKPPK